MRKLSQDEAKEYNTSSVSVRKKRVFLPMTTRNQTDRKFREMHHIYISIVNDIVVS